MTTFIKTKFKISDYQTNIELILQPILQTDLESPSNFQVKEKKIIQIGKVTAKQCFN